MTNIHDIVLQIKDKNVIWEDKLEENFVQTFVRVSYICNKKENQCYTEVAQKSGKRFSYEIYYNRRNQIKTACSRICNKT